MAAVKRPRRRAFGADGVERLVQGGKNPPLAEGGGDPVAPDVREQVRVHAPEDDANVFPGQVVEQGANGLRGGKVDVGDRFRVAQTPDWWSSEVVGQADRSRGGLTIPEAPTVRARGLAT